MGQQSQVDVAAMAAAPGRDGPAAWVDLERYPMLDLEADPGRGFVTRCREQFDRTGTLVLEGFLCDAAAGRALAELEGLLGQAYYCQKRHNPYLSQDDARYPADHARNRTQVSDLGALADDQIPQATVLRGLYHWDRLQALVAALLGVPRLYPYADPLGSLNLNIFQPGQQLGWHFDNADYAVTLLLQPAEMEGAFEYIPDLRAPGQENYAAIEQALDGRHEGRRRLAMGVGALVLFRGRHSLHRVTPVEGSRPRLVAVLSYDTEPGIMLTEHNRRLFYGRVA